MPNKNAQRPPAPIRTPMFINMAESANLSPAWAMFFHILGLGSGVLPISGDGMTFEGTHPQVDGSGLGAGGNAPLTLQGSNTVDGRIVLSPGAVTGANKSRVSIPAQELDDPALVVVEGTIGAVTTGTGIFQIQKNNGIPVFQVLYSADPTGASAVIVGGAGVFPGTANVGTLGLAAQRWNQLWTNGVDASAAINTATVFSIGGVNGVSGTIAMAKLTTGGANGSITVVGGIITGFVNPT